MFRFGDLTFYDGFLTLGVFGVIFYFVFLSRLRRGKRLEPLKGPLAGSVEGGFFREYFRGSYSGTPVEIRFKAGGEDEADVLKLALFSPSGVELSVGERGLLSGALAFFGGMKEVPSGDPAWDKKYYSAAKDAAAAAAWLASSARRESLSALFELGYGKFFAGPEKAEVWRYHRDEAAALEPGLVMKTFSLLAAAVKS